MNRTAIDEVMNQIKYGWIDKNGRPRESLSGVSTDYVLQLPDELLESKLGVCWDQVELERKLFADQGVATHTYFIVYYDGKNDPTHTFLLCEDEGKIVWYEHAWSAKTGWHEFSDVKSALREVRKCFIAAELHGDFDPRQLCIFEYEAPNAKLNCQEFYRHCGTGKSLNENL